MLTLVIDTATPSVTAGVFEVAETVASKGDHAVVDARGHGERLAPMIDASLKDAAAVPGDLAAIVVGLGPGPFTGLRVGLVTAASMADALGIPAYGVCSLDALGLAAARSVEEPGRILVATDARRKEVYWGLYDEEGRRLHGPEVEKPDRLQSHIAEAAHLAGDGTLLYPQHFPEALETPRFPPAWAFAELAADRVRVKAPTEPLTPLYLRRPDVHVNGKQQRL
ncbi:tRNA threonylcarbamoyl adenosine modification protein YeaZ [Stackebrandtia endophytica]|uniref:tRNA threonylcarbamoyl adenosine modification protein YeaZ n=1 Tax=Stackebrandtia endophytica TaxID=1496996 RepID=A0A543AVE5_9ACTN|nr:tRNA (adenosine(37)-N6)-threonylcarbamoyltransferase complex dimerization subunit type 1 TsaB [Stackebrandtia endophytica]TQL76560.1 tRNA threonylcarbamoyl adenosine modification protein YeaZ [Stackebrandtia endophytica]